MGVCQSCLGRREKDDYEESEENRLLYDDGHGMQYGSFNDPAMSCDDTLEAQREHEALQRVVAKTSNNMVDVFEIGPHDSSNRGGTSTPFAYAGQGARVARYQHLVSKLSAEDENASHGVKVDWLTDDENLEMQSNRPASINTLEDNGGPLVGTFADAAAAMK
ncbi:hypothetical protein QQS21_008084 [Conoideocrella luteorostrata]|uniref:Late endosomal/lysosomal adaptor and MAPK and MTOR activator-domain-containing protein n=1 Tax=Conoideocrella luteorostrata TaxID=1105319 RepID=A0AAJ0FYY6_9HYPO|nr:hypothetical protein QQS21_008084 [Conoideocrella luteorostrata]